MNASDTEQKVADILLDKKIVTFSFNPPYVYTTGLKSPIYIDNRMLISYPKERAYIVDQMVSLIKSKKELADIDYISSTLSYAAPFGVLIAATLGLPLVLVREEERTHGKLNKIEGYLPKGATVLVVEDHISTAAALLDNVNTIRASGGIVNYAVAITDYEIDIAKKALQEGHVTVSVLAKGLSIVKEAAKTEVLKEKDKDEVLEWLKNPVKWGEDRGYYYNSD